MKNLVLLTGIASTVIGIDKAESAQVVDAERPNVVFILADDLGWRDLSCTGSTYYETPNIDQLAKSGIMFTQGYSACQVSSPSRASIMTGKYTPSHDITNFIGALTGEQWRTQNRATKLLPPEYAMQLPAQDVTLAEALREEGYKTFFAGKWHLGDIGSYPEDHGFDINKGGTKAGGPGAGYFPPYRNAMLKDGAKGEELSMRLAQETASFIKNHRATEPKRPFLAYLSFYAVHAPIETTYENWKYFRDKAIKEKIEESGFKKDRLLPVRQSQDNPVYAGLIRQMDQAVGLLLDQLKTMGLMDNTIIFFTSDNGGVSSGDAYATCNLPLRGGKGRAWEGGIRVPLLVKLPRSANAESTCDVPVIGTDFYPTILDLAGLSLRPAQHIDGVSVKQLLYGGAIAKRDLYWHYPHYGNQGGEPSSIIRDGDWKLIFYHEDGRNELYNLAKDPSESDNIEKVHPAKVTELRARLDKWLLQNNAKMPTIDPLYDKSNSEKTANHRFNNALKNVETQRKEMLKPDWKPNDDWWGSMITID